MLDSETPGVSIPVNLNLQSSGGQLTDLWVCIISTPCRRPYYIVRAETNLDSFIKQCMDFPRSYTLVAIKIGRYFFLYGDQICREDTHDVVLKAVSAQFRVKRTSARWTFSSSHECSVVDATTARAIFTARSDRKGNRYYPIDHGCHLRAGSLRFCRVVRSTQRDGGTRPWLHNSTFSSI